MYERFYLCYNSHDLEIFNIGCIDNCPPLYLKNMYHLIMRLDYNPKEEGTDDESIIVEICFNEVVNLLKTGNYIQEEHGLYIVDYTYNGLDEEIDSFIRFASSFNSSLAVDSHEVNIFSPSSADDSHYSSPSSSSSTSASSSSYLSSLRVTASLSDEAMHHSTDSETGMSYENLNEE